MGRSDVAVIVPTFERPEHLRRALLSLRAQQGVDVDWEVVVSDDGSADGTAAVVDQLASTLEMPVRWLTQPHAGFCPARCRNRAIAASDGEYLVFIDGDCVVPPDHLACHLARRQQGFALVGAPLYLDAEASARVSDQSVREETFHRSLPRGYIAALVDRLHQLLRHPTRPKLSSGFFSAWREDLERVNGFDQRFVGWGCEDDDLRLRLRRAGVRFRSLLPATRAYHLHHPPHPSRARRWRDGANVAYLQRPLRLSRCVDGLIQRSPDDVAIRTVGAPIDLPSSLRDLEAGGEGGRQAAEIEVLVVPGAGCFSGRAEGNVLVVLEGQPPPAHKVGRADVVLSDHDVPAAGHGPRWPIGSAGGLRDQVLRAEALMRSDRIPA
jgi:GT2 family glycosyltransferase